MSGKYGMWAFDIFTLNGIRLLYVWIVNLNTLIVVTLSCLGELHSAVHCVVLFFIQKFNYIKHNYTKLKDLVCFHFMVLGKKRKKYPQFQEDYNDFQQ